MANLYNVLPGLQPNQQEIAEAELLAKQILEANFPDLDMREGTGVRDTVIRPSALLLALVKKGLDNYFAQNTIAGVTNNTPNEVVDNILSNLFLNRNLGTRAVINSRLYFARQKNVTMTPDIFFSPDNQIRFFPQEAATYNQSALEYDSFTNEYFLDVDMVAELEGEEFNIGEGSLLYFANFDPYFLRAEINYLKEASIAAETNEEFIDRAETAISTRNLINVPSIDANLRSTFNYLGRIFTVGMGAPEMIRDQVRAIIDEQTPRVVQSILSQNGLVTITLLDHGYETGQRIRVSGADPSSYNGDFLITRIDKDTFTYAFGSGDLLANIPRVAQLNEPVLIHNGGMTDIYCSERLANSIVQVITDAQGRAELTGPIYKFARSEISGGTEEDVIPFEEELNMQAWSLNQESKLMTVQHGGRNIPNGTVMSVEGLSQYQTISTITCFGLEVTAVTGQAGPPVGASVTIEGVTPVQYNGTFTVTESLEDGFKYLSPVIINDNGDGSTKRAYNRSLNAEYPATVTGGHSFTLFIGDVWEFGVVEGTVVLKYETPYSWRNKHARTEVASNAVISGQEVTVTKTRHGLTIGRYVDLTSTDLPLLNGTWLIHDVLDENRFVVGINEFTSGTTNRVSVSYVTPWEDFGFSQRQAYVVDFGPDYAFRSASFEIDYFQYLDGVQEYLEASDSRVLCGDLLARGYNMYILDVLVNTYNGPAADSQAVASSVNRYLRSLNPGSVIVVADMIAQLHRDGITGIQTPIGVTYKKYTRDLIEAKEGTITDYLDPDDRTNLFVLGNVTTTNEFI